MSLDRLVCADRGDVGGVVGCSLVESSVRATVVVVLDVFLRLSMLVFVPDDGAVEEFVTMSGPIVRCLRWLWATAAVFWSR